MDARPRYMISIAAELVGMHPQTLRIYENKGLVSPKRTRGNTRLYYAGAGGTIYYVTNPDSIGHGSPVHQVFYTSLANYQSNAAAYNSTVFINTPITADTNGNVFFGFRVQGTAPAPPATS